MDIEDGRMFGPERDEIIEGRITFHNEELHNLDSTNINRIIKSRNMR
jgi:hypothetical protein